MKTTGMARRIDELGRVVIPKGMRQTCGIVTGDFLEIRLTDDGGIALYKYDAVRPTRAAVANLKAQVREDDLLRSNTRAAVLQKIGELETLLTREGKA
jgi:AbrB family looped-hinge helix DNA binding protein